MVFTIPEIYIIFKFPCKQIQSWRWRDISISCWIYSLWSYTPRSLGISTKIGIASNKKMWTSSIRAISSWLSPCWLEVPPEVAQIRIYPKRSTEAQPSLGTKHFIGSCFRIAPILYKTQDSESCLESCIFNKAQEIIHLVPFSSEIWLSSVWVTKGLRSKGEFKSAKYPYHFQVPSA